MHANACRAILLAAALWLGRAPVAAAGAEEPVDRFVRAYAQAWGARSPIPLIRLAASPTLLADVVALERWDALAETVVEVRLERAEPASRGRTALLLLRRQSDRFLGGTYAQSVTRERVVVGAFGGRLRIVGYDGALEGAVRSAEPDTWPPARSGERAVAGALSALASLSGRVCLERLAPLFTRPDTSQPSLRLAEPFQGRKTALANAFFARAACVLLILEHEGRAAGAGSGGSPTGTGGPGSRGSTVRDRIRADLDRSIRLDPEHALARLLRARLRFLGLSDLPEVDLESAMGAVVDDLQMVERLVPEGLEDAPALLHMLRSVREILREGDEASRARRMRIARILLRAPGKIAGPLLRRLGGAEDLFSAGPGALAVAAEIAVADGRMTEASRLLELLGIRCEQCVPYLYLRGRESQILRRPEAALGYYAAVIESQPTYRDAAWRYAVLGLGQEKRERERVIAHLSAAVPRLAPEEARVMRIVLSLVGRRWHSEELIQLVTERYAEGRIPSAVRMALVDALQER